MIASFRDIENLLRLHAVGFTFIWPALAYLLAAPNPSPGTLLGLLAITTLYSVFGYLHNDLCDLESDRRDPERQHRPLVSGAIAEKHAVAIVVSLLCMMLLLQLVLPFPDASGYWLGSSIVAMAIYNRISKRLYKPLLADATLGIAGITMSGYAITLAGEVNTHAMAMVVATFAYLVIINAFHNGLRDLAVEAPLGIRTTPTQLGCRVDNNGHVHISRLMILYGHLLQAGVVGLPVLAALSEPFTLNVAFVCASAIANVLIFVAFMQATGHRWYVLLRLHIVTLPIPALIFGLGDAPAWAVQLVWISYFFPLLLADNTLRVIQRGVREFVSSPHLQKDVGNS